MLFHFNKSCITVKVVIIWSVKEINRVPGDIHINLSLLIQSTKKVLLPQRTQHTIKNSHFKVSYGAPLQMSHISARTTRHTTAHHTPQLTAVLSTSHKVQYLSFFFSLPMQP